VTEDQKRRWDVRLAVIAPLLTVATIVVGIWQVNREARDRLDQQTRLAQVQDDLEFRRKLWADEMDRCTEATQLAARIAAEVDFGGRPMDLIKDWTARYWSVSLALDPAEPLDKTVETALIEYRADLEDFLAGGFDEDLGSRLKVHSHALGVACARKIRAGSSDLLKRAERPST
jgi:hypothetical protein